MIISMSRYGKESRLGYGESDEEYPGNCGEEEWNEE